MIYAVETVLARKLDVADVLESNAMAFEAAVGAAVVGDVEYGEGPHPTNRETIHMVNIIVRITRGDDHFPKASASYSRIEWATLDSFRSAADDRDPIAIFPGEHPFRVCIHGLCISSSRAVVELLDDPSVSTQ